MNIQTIPYTKEMLNLEKFRLEMYQTMGNGRDARMNLIDAMCSMEGAKSVVEYSLAECYERSHTTINYAIGTMKLGEKWLANRLVPYLPKPSKELPFWLLMVDVTPAPRPYARTLEDRGMVYQPEVVKGKLPVTIGHQYSTVTLGLEKEEGMTSSWGLPLMNKRVETSANTEEVGREQIDLLMSDDKLPFAKDLTVEVADSSYSKPEYLHPHRKHKNLVSIVRVAGNRSLYHKHELSEEEKAIKKNKPGKTKVYGEKFSLLLPDTLGEPDDSYTYWETSRRGKLYRYEVKAWKNKLMSGKRLPETLDMSQHPFTLVQIICYDEEGNRACKNPLWLIVVGGRRGELTLKQIVQAYAARFDIEHFFRFGKQKLLMASFQTPIVEHEENWWQLCHIAYAQLWMARHVAHSTPRPWERNLPDVKQNLISPTLVMRDFARIIRQFGTPAKPPKPRGDAPGWTTGTSRTKRERQNVYVKSQAAASEA